jgi:hypothetical protein
LTLRARKSGSKDCFSQLLNNPPQIFSIADLTMLQHTIDPDRRDYEGKAATFSRPDGTLVWVKKPDGSFAY